MRGAGCREPIRPTTIGVGGRGEPSTSPPVPPDSPRFEPGERLATSGASLILLAIETSCDETAAAVLEGPRPPEIGVPRIRSSVVASQVGLHQRYGGVVPEIASRAHVRQILPMIDEALRRAGFSLRDLGAVAVTTRPGLVGSLVVGLTAAKALAMALEIPPDRRRSPGRAPLRLSARLSRPRSLSVRRLGGFRRTYQPVPLPEPSGIDSSGRDRRRRGGGGFRQGGEPPRIGLPPVAQRSSESRRIAIAKPSHFPDRSSTTSA